MDDNNVTLHEHERPNFIASHDVRLICQMLSEVQVGKLISYETMSKLIGKDVQTEGRSALISARRIVQREYGHVFGTIYRKGIKRLSDIEIVQTGPQTMIKIRHASRRGVDRLAKAAPEKLPLEARVTQNTYLSMLALMYAATQEKQLKKLESRVALTESRLPLDKTLEAFRDDDPPKGTTR